ncbi:hypothetical protein E1B28_002892 [Marasmius oreades]|uniref:DUF6534 domain-containing protein n=1 Tax=Marasmius oreades TaxID=181124 RepID=A0A9P7UJZ7_9AGAR|nr:uncharacterized protein E1B28_002892 [Marasmius oreades]KAG7085325.1 hypothetical protein E1B28_002892 [Marasmius oreades]
MSSPTPAIPPVDDTLGAALIGFGLSCIILGFLSKEVFIYYGRYPNDKMVYKVIVSVIGMLELMEEAAIGHYLYYYVVSNYTNPAAFFVDNFVWSLMLPVAIGATVGTIVKLCFAMRVWRFSNNVYITGLIAILTLSQLSLSITYTVKSFMLQKLVRAEELRLIASLSLGSGALTDTITALTLCYYLRKFRTGFGQSQQLAYKLSLYAINTGLLTSVMSLGALIFYDAHPTTFQFTPFYYNLSRCTILLLL